MKLKGRGMPDLNGRGRGDELVEVVVETPRRLSSRQEELLRELAEIEHEDVSPKAQELLRKAKRLLHGGRRRAPAGNLLRPCRPAPTVRGTDARERDRPGSNHEQRQWPKTNPDMNDQPEADDQASPAAESTSASDTATTTVNEELAETQRSAMNLSTSSS